MSTGDYINDMLGTVVQASKAEGYEAVAKALGEARGELAEVKDKLAKSREELDGVFVELAAGMEAKARCGRLEGALRHLEAATRQAMNTSVDDGIIASDANDEVATALIVARQVLAKAGGRELSTKFNKQALAQLQAAKLPHMHAADWATVKEDSEEARVTMATLETYLAAFVKQEDGTCICCGALQGGKDMMDALLGRARFRWGLAYGEGCCSDCGYPGRAHHYVSKEPELTIKNTILQYHPEGLSFGEKGGGE